MSKEILNNHNFELPKIRLNGYNVGTIKNTNGGRNITVSGWSYEYQNLNKGDNVLLISTSGQESRYKITRIEYMYDPSDQFFIDLEFNPR